MFELYRRWSTLSFPWIKDDEDNTWELLGIFTRVEDIENQLKLLPKHQANTYKYKIRNMKGEVDG